MSARSIANATISFGLVSIPVRLFSATQASSAVSFNLLHAKCSGRLKQQYVCPTEDNMVVERGDMVKGYEFAKDRYVTFTPEELKALEEKATQSIDISEFVPASKIDPVYFDKAYYLGPDKGGDRAYRLLSEAMLATGRTALARYAARGKQYLVQLRPMAGGGLVMQQLLYADEVRPFAELGVDKMVDVKDQELKLAEAIIGQISHEEFKPEQYEDEVRKRVLEQIDRKVQGQDIQLTPPEQPQTQIIDLMEALKASLAARESGAKAPAPKSATGAPAAPEATAPQAAEAAEAQSERKPAKRAPRAAESAKGKASRK
jgi:DNA end-binding protein Ku